jgi:hypothetical protein
LKASEAPVLKERISTKELNWAIRSAEAHSYSRGGFACYEVLADGDERYGDFGPTCYAPITPWYTLPSPPIFQGKGFIFTNLSHALPKPTLLALQRGITDRGGRIVSKWSGSVAVVVTDDNRTTSITLTKATHYPNIPVILVAELEAAFLLVPPTSGSGSSGGGGGGRRAE